MELHIRGVSKTYGNGVQALKNVTLTFPQASTGCSDPTVPVHADAHLATLQASAGRAMNA